MRRLHKAITALLVVLCIAGAAFAFVFLRKEQRLATQRQQEIGEVAKQLEPCLLYTSILIRKRWRTALERKTLKRSCTGCIAPIYRAGRKRGEAIDGVFCIVV